MSATPLRAAVIGTGFVGPFHVDAIRRGGYGTVVALAGSDPDRTRARAASLGVEGARTAGEVIADPTIDVVHVCTPNRTHADLAVAALDAGKHLMIEKPLAMSVQEGLRIAEAANRSGRHVGVAYSYRGYAMLRRARDLVRGGQAGNVRLVHGGYVQDWLADERDYNWRLEPEISGESRAVADIGTHWFDAAEFVTGLRVESVMSDLATFIPSRRRPTGAATAFAASTGEGEPFQVASEDAAVILLRFAGGALGSCVVSQVSPGRKNAFTIEISGAARTLDWDQEDAEHLWLRDRERSVLLTRGLADAPDDADRGMPSLPAGHPEGWADAFRDLFRPFYAAIARGDPPPQPGEPAPYPTVADGLRGLRFVETVLESARTERWTALDAS